METQHFKVKAKAPAALRGWERALRAGSTEQEQKGAPAPRTSVEDVGQDGHDTELVLLTRLLGDVLVDDLWGPEDKG